MKKTKTKDPVFYILTVGGEIFFLLSIISFFLLIKSEYGSYYYSLGEYIISFALKEIIVTVLTGLFTYIFNFLFNKSKE